MYFKECKTREEIKKRFAELCKKLHPDCGGNAEDFIQMYAEFKKIFNDCRNEKTENDPETENEKDPEYYNEIITSIIHYKDVKIEILGTWIWVSGNTYIYKDDLKKKGFIYSKSKKAWYHPSEKYHRKRGTMSLQKIREKFGSEEVKTKKINYIGA